MLRVPVDTPREQRIALRMASGEKMQGCVRSGYVIGSDPATKRRSDAHLLAFLGRMH